MKNSRSLAALISLILATYATVATAAGFSSAASLSSARSQHTTTLLPSNQVLVVGGTGAAGSAERYDPVSNAWSAAASPAAARIAHTATLLPSGKVLVVGGGGSANTAELYDPVANTWSPGGAMAFAHQNHTATLLQSGKVLVVGGGSVPAAATVAVEIYDPSNNTFNTAASVNAGRLAHSATLLRNGDVLVVGGLSGAGDLRSAERYNPTTNVWTTVGAMIRGRNSHSATLLPSGKVLVAGGCCGTSSPLGNVSVAELFDPATNAWTDTGALATGRNAHHAAMLPSGKVLVTGGVGNSGFLSSAELYDPVAGTWSSAGNLAQARYVHSSTLLASGKLLITGGLPGASAANPSNAPVASAELYDGAIPAWSAAAPIPTSARQFHTATLLPSGKVMMAGGTSNANNYLNSVSLYDSGTNAWANVSGLTENRSGHTATLLRSGQVLVTGGSGGDFGGSSNSAERADPTNLSPPSGGWVSAGTMSAARSFHTATLLPSGNVLVAAGATVATTVTALNSADIYNATTNAWSAAAPLSTARYDHTATHLPSGMVLVVAGRDTSGAPIATPERYDAATNTWGAAATMSVGRYRHSATLLPSGKVLVAGGRDATVMLGSAELYDPTTDTWSSVASMATARSAHTATLLTSGLVLVAGGEGGIASSELYDPASNTWTTSASLAVGRSSHTATLLTTGQIFVTGGLGSASTTLTTARYDVGLGFAAASRPVVTTVSTLTNPFAVGFPLQLVGSKFTGDGDASGGGTQNSASNLPLAQLRRLDNDGIQWTTPGAANPGSATQYTSTALNGFPLGWYAITLFSAGVPSETKIARLLPVFPVTTAASPASDGTLVCASPIVEGSPPNCTATPNSGFITHSISGCNGTATGPTANSYTSGAVTAACTVTATFAPIINGTCGAAHTVPTATAPTADLCGYSGVTPIVTSGIGNFGRFNWVCSGSNTGTSANCNAPRLYTVTTSATPAGTGSLSCPSPVVGGATSTCTATPNPGFITQSISSSGSGGCGGSATAPTVNSFTTLSIAANCTVTATFVPIINGVCGTAHTVPTLTAPNANLCGAGGASSVSSPNANEFRWSCQGSNTGTNATCNAPRLYTITASATPAGTGTLSCPSSVIGGTTATCTAVPNPGFITQSISASSVGIGGCGASSPTGPTVNSFTTVNNDRNCTVTATFVPIINGTCGTAHTVPTFSAPSTNLCGAGSETGVTTTIPNFTWACNGSNTGSNASCTAPRQFAISVIVDPAAAGSVSCTPNPGLGAGNSTCSVTATNAGFAFNAFNGGCTGATCNLSNISAPVAVTANFNRTQTITGFNPPASVVIGAAPLALSASGGASGSPVVFASSSASSVCTVSGNQVTFVGAGSCNLTADQAAASGYNAAPQLTRSITISKATPALALTGNGSSTYGDNVSFSATLTSAFAPTGSVEFKADGNTIAGCAAKPISANGASCATTALTGGTRSITAVYSGDGNNLTATAPAVTHTVNRTAQTLSFGAQTPNRQALVINATVALNPLAIAGASSSPVIYAAAPSTVCSISGTTITMLAPGNCAITANQAADANYNAAAAVTQTINIVATLDIDRSQASTQYHATTDGLLLMRYLQNVRGAALVAGATGSTAIRTDPATVAAYLDAIKPQLDIDQDGQVDPQTDGLLILRYLLGLRGTALTQNALATAPRVPLRTFPTDIEAAIQALLP